MQFRSLVAALALATAALAVPVDIVSTPQCGGKQWTGPTTCLKTDYVCFEFNDYYSECIHKTQVASWSVGKPVKNE
ncbi:hypothetical protein FA13DRAFT_1809244 [Coprinellus micaceus]|uniref:CBM1 domain-containing protein n=1 Tax=Coprinellus micaceus TaxID=71717 RepID=A0A4Y7TWC9_COPMI|nr:hypothetical protein FA13DRAFT_1809244 [Coprinellus micaceus]